MTKSFEVMMLAILPAALKCEWNLSSAEEATITMVTTYIHTDNCGDIFINVRSCFLDFCWALHYGELQQTSWEGKEYVY